MTKKVTHIWILVVVFLQISLVTENNVIYSTYGSLTLLIPFLNYLFMHRKTAAIDKFNLLYIVFIIYLLSSSLWSPFFIDINEFKRPVLISTFLLLLYNLCRWSDGVRFIMIAFILLEHLNFLIYLTGYPRIFFGSIYNGSRFQGTFENSNGAGFCFLIAMIFSIYFIRKTRNRLAIYSLHTCLATGVILILATGSKKCVLGLLIVAALYVPIILKSTAIRDNFKKVLTVLAVTVLLSTFSSTLHLQIITSNISERFLNFSTQIEKGGARLGGGSTAERIALIKSGLEGIPEKLLLGHGYDSFQYYHFGMVSHCNYIELLFNGGCLALMLYYSRYLLALKDAFKMKRDKDVCVATISLLLLLEIGSISFYSKLFLYAFTAIILLIEGENTCRQKRNQAITHCDIDVQR